VDVQQNKNSMFYYQEIRVEMDGGLIRQNMPFTLGIQKPWQKEMMIVTTLALGSRPRQGLTSVQAKRKAQESHLMLSRMQESVRE
jgi:hypothetical protein